MNEHDATEQWKPIKGYEGTYSVSTLGRVRREQGFRWGGCCGIAYVRERILKPTNQRGYSIVGLSLCNKLKRKQVHRLVAEAFIPNPQNLPQVNHKDENPKNNTVENLEWCTSEYNANYGHRNEKVSKSRQSEKSKKQWLEALEKTKKKVMCIDTGEMFCSTVDAEKATGAKHSNISLVCMGKRKRAGGYKWTYIQ